eukprot:g10580.t1
MADSRLSPGRRPDDQIDECPYVRDLSFLLKRSIVLKVDQGSLEGKAQQYVRQAAEKKATIEKTLDKIYNNTLGHTALNDESRFKQFEKRLQSKDLRFQGHDSAEGKRKMQDFAAALAAAMLATVRYSHPSAKTLLHEEEDAGDFVYLLARPGRDFVTYMRQVIIMLQVYGKAGSKDFRTHPLVTILLCKDRRLLFLEAVQILIAWTRYATIGVLPETAPDYESSVIKLGELCPVAEFLLPQSQELFDCTPGTLKEMSDSFCEEKKLLMYPFPEDDSQQAVEVWTDQNLFFTLPSSTTAGAAATATAAAEHKPTTSSSVWSEIWTKEGGAPTQERQHQKEQLTPSKQNRRPLSAGGEEAQGAAAASKPPAKRSGSAKASPTRKRSTKKDQEPLLEKEEKDPPLHKKDVLAKSNADVLRLNGKGLMPTESVRGKGKAAAELLTKTTQEHTLQNLISGTAKQCSGFPKQQHDLAGAYYQQKKQVEFAPETEEVITKAREVDVLAETEERLKETLRDLQEAEKAAKPPAASPPPSQKSGGGVPKPQSSPIAGSSAQSLFDLQGELSHRMMSRASLQEEKREREERERAEAEKQKSYYEGPYEPDYDFTHLMGGSGLDGMRESRFREPRIPPQVEQDENLRRLREEEIGTLRTRAEELRQKIKEAEQRQAQREADRAERERQRERIEQEQRDRARARFEQQEQNRWTRNGDTRMPHGVAHAAGNFFDLISKLDDFSSSRASAREGLQRRKENPKKKADPLAGMVSTANPEGKKKPEAEIDSYEQCMEIPVPVAHELAFNEEEATPAQIWLKVASVPDPKSKNYFQNPRPAREIRELLSNFYVRKSKQRNAVGDVIPEPLEQKALRACSLKSAIFWLIEEFDHGRLENATEDVATLVLTGLMEQDEFEDTLDKYAIDGKIENKESSLVVPAGPSTRARAWKACQAIARDAATLSGEQCAALKLQDRKIFSQIRSALSRCLKDVRSCSYARGYDPTTAAPDNFEKAISQFRLKDLFVGDGKWWKDMELKDRLKLLQTFLDRLDNYPNKSCQVDELELAYHQWASLAPAVTKGQQVAVRERQQKKHKEKEEEKKKHQQLTNTSGNGNGGDGGGGQWAKNRWNRWDKNKNWKKNSNWKGSWWKDNNRDRATSSLTFGTTVPPADKREGDTSNTGDKRRRADDGTARPGTVEVSFIREKVAQLKQVTPDEIKERKDICCYHLGFLCEVCDDKGNAVKCLSRPVCARCRKDKHHTKTKDYLKSLKDR